jgi:hypothetical protein
MQALASSELHFFTAKAAAAKPRLLECVLSYEKRLGKWNTVGFVTSEVKSRIAKSQSTLPKTISRSHSSIVPG